jgi:hypothetical protein
MSSIHQSIHSLHDVREWTWSINHSELNTAVHEIARTRQAVRRSSWLSGDFKDREIYEMIYPVAKHAQRNKNQDITYVAVLARGT